MGYEHLNIDEREVILKMRAHGQSMRQIGDEMGRNAGTISRELSRNISSTHDYKAHLAQRYYEKRREASKEPYRLEDDEFLREYVEEKLKDYWSPEQISGRLKKDLEMHISPLTVYSWIYRNHAEGGEFYRHTRRTQDTVYGSNKSSGQIGRNGHPGDDFGHEETAAGESQDDDVR